MTPTYHYGDCGSEKGRPIFHIARSKSQRRQEEPNATVGDTEYGICMKYNIRFNCFRKWNKLPPREVDRNVTISVGKRYIVGYEPVFSPVEPIDPIQPDPQPTVNPEPAPKPAPKPQPTKPSHSFDFRRKYLYQLAVSDRCLDYMRSWERPPIVNGRISGQVFRDTKGSLTIGFGHWIKEENKHLWREYDPEQGGTRSMTMREMEELFRRDVALLAEADVKKQVNTRLLQQEYDALVDFTFHRGAGALRDSGLVDHINRHPNGHFDYGAIMDMFMKYAFWFDRESGQWQWVEGFAKRRREEINMFRYGIYTLHR